MKTIKNIIYPTLAAFAFASFAVSPGAQAVNPPPDGGYPGANTAEGTSALLSLSTGTYNTAFGFFSLLSNADTSFNTGVGAATLLLSEMIIFGGYSPYGRQLADTVLPIGLAADQALTPARTILLQSQ